MSGRNHLWSPWQRGRTVPAQRYSRWTSSFWCAVSAWIGTGAPRFCLVYIPSVKGEGLPERDKGPTPRKEMHAINKENVHTWEGGTNELRPAGDEDLIAVDCERTKNSEYWARVLPRIRLCELLPNHRAARGDIRQS